MNKDDAKAAIREAILGTVQEAAVDLVKRAVESETPEAAKEAAEGFHATLILIKGASECALRALDATFDSPVPSGATETDADYRKRLLRVIDSGSIHYGSALVVIGQKLDDLGALYDCKRR